MTMSDDDTRAEVKRLRTEVERLAAELEAVKERVKAQEPHIFIGPGDACRRCGHGRMDQTIHPPIPMRMG